MADWKKLAKAALLADGKIDSAETEIIRKEIFADHKVDKTELDFLQDLRNSASSCDKAFTALFLEAVKSNLLADAEISDDEANWLRTAIFADGKVDADEKKLMQDLKKGAKKTSAGFEKLLAEVMKA